MTTTLQNEEQKKFAYHEKKRGRIRIKTGLSFTLIEGKYPVKEIIKITLNNILYYKLTISLKCLAKKSQKERKMILDYQKSKKSEIYKILDPEERRRRVLEFKESSIDMNDIFNDVFSEYTMYIKVDSILASYLNILDEVLYIQGDLLKYRGEIEHILTINIRSPNSFAPNTHSNASHSLSGIYSRSIKQKNIYVFAYFDKLEEFLILPGCLIDEQSITPF